MKEHEKKLGKTQSQINITRSEFQRSFKNHYGMYKKTGTDMPYRSRLLMLFYSVECGLKSLILKNIGKNTYEELKSYYTINGKKAPGHDLKAMTKEVGIETKFPLKGFSLRAVALCYQGNIMNCGDMVPALRTQRRNRVKKRLWFGLQNGYLRGYREGE